MDDPTVMLAATKDRPAGWSRPAQLEMDVAFEAISGPHYAVGGAQGHFEQTGRVSGTISLGDERWDVDGFGVRDKSWGPRTWQAPSGTAAKAAGPAAVERGCFLNWFSMNFGADLALGGRLRPHGRRHVPRQGLDPARRRDARPRGGHDDDRVRPDEPAAARDGAAARRPTARGASIVVDGTVLTICPTKIPRRDGVTFVNEGLARFETDGRVGFGIAEHWHAVAATAQCQRTVWSSIEPNLRSQ